MQLTKTRYASGADLLSTTNLPAPHINTLSALTKVDVAEGDADGVPEFSLSQGDQSQVLAVFSFLLLLLVSIIIQSSPPPPPPPNTAPSFTASPHTAADFKSRICFFLVVLYDSFYRRFTIPPFFRQSREQRYWGVDCIIWTL